MFITILAHADATLRRTNDLPAIPAEQVFRERLAPELPQMVHNFRKGLRLPEKFDQDLVFVATAAYDRVIGTADDWPPIRMTFLFSESPRPQDRKACNDIREMVLGMLAIWFSEQKFALLRKDLVVDLYWGPRCGFRGLTDDALKW